MLTAFSLLLLVSCSDKDGATEALIQYNNEEWVPINEMKESKLNDMHIEAEDYAKDHFKNIIVYYEGGNVSEKDIDQYSEELKEKYQDPLDYRKNVLGVFEFFRK